MILERENDEGVDEEHSSKDFEEREREMLFYFRHWVFNLLLLLMLALFFKTTK